MKYSGKNKNQIAWKEIPKEVQEFMKRTDELVKKGKIKPIDERTALENSLFPTIVRRAIGKN